MIVACFVRVFCEKKSSQFTFNVHSCWSFNGRRYASGDFINLEDLSAQSVEDAHRGRVACVYSSNECACVCTTVFRKRESLVLAWPCYATTVDVMLY